MLGIVFAKFLGGVRVEYRQVVCGQLGKKWGEGTAGLEPDRVIVDHYDLLHDIRRAFPWRTDFRILNTIEGYLTASAVNGVPSWNVTPSRR